MSAHHQLRRASKPIEPDDNHRHLCKLLRIEDQFDVLYEEGATLPRVMCIALHPYLTGVPHRIRALDRALAQIAGHDGAWLATGSEIIDAWRASPEARISVCRSSSVGGRLSPRKAPRMRSTITVRGNT